MANKIRFGLRRVKYAIYDPSAEVYELTSDVAINTQKVYYTRSGSAGSYVYTAVASPDVTDIGAYYELTSTGEYGTPMSFPGAVSMSMSREGGDATDFYADDGVYFTFGGSNGGYTVELNMAMVTDEIRQALLGEEVDANGVQWEYTGVEPSVFALIFETQGDQNPVAFTMYGCKASRIETFANTKSDSQEVDTDTMSIRVAGSDFIVEGDTKHAIQSHLVKTASNVETYNAYFATVATPAVAGADSSSS